MDQSIAWRMEIERARQLSPSEGQMRDLINAVAREIEDQNKQDEFLKKFDGGRIVKEIHTEGGNYVENAINISVQTINMAFSTLMDPGQRASEELSKAWAKMPKLKAYVEAAPILSARKENHEEIEEAIREREAAVDHMISDSLGAALTIRELSNPNEAQWIALLGLEDTPDEVKKLQSLPPEYYTTLSFAVLLHNVFSIIQKTRSAENTEEAEQAKEMDYSPVALLYCKIVESMLKHEHTPKYIRCLSSAKLKTGGTKRFRDLGDPDQFDINHKDLTMGSFSTQLVFVEGFDSNTQLNGWKSLTDITFCFDEKSMPDHSKINYKNNIGKLIGNIIQNGELTREWKAHAKLLWVINQIRNRAVHRLEPISKETFNWMVEILFKDRELYRIWELSK